MGQGSMMRTFLACLLAVLTFVPALGMPSAVQAAERDRAALSISGDTPRGSTEVAAHLLVRFSPSATLAQREAAIRSVGGLPDGGIPALGIVRIAIPNDPADALLGTRASVDATVLAATLAREPGVESVEPDARLGVEFSPNDQYYASDPFGGTGQWGIRKAQVDRAWDVVRSRPITIAVIDTGVDPGHPDLAGALVPGRTFVSSPSATCPTGDRDDNAHGSHVSGIIVANADNSIGIAGVAFGARVMPLKALDCTGVGALSDVAQAIVYATDQGARIVNISLGSTSDSSTLRAAVQYAASRNVLVVAAAGNCGVITTQNATRCPTQDQPNYPAAYPEALAVAATELDDTRATFSTQAAYVGIAAPGRRIVSTVPTYTTSGTTSIGYASFSGTSQAAPFIAGVAALIWSREPTLTAAQVRERLRATADDLGVPGVDPAFGAGRVNALRAVTVVPPPPPVAPVVPAAPATGARYGATYAPVGAAGAATLGVAGSLEVKLTNTGTLTWPAAGSTPVRLSYHWLDAAGQVAVWDGQRTVLPRDVLSGESVTVALGYAPPVSSGTYTLRIDLVHEGVSWFSGLGVPPHDLRVPVSSGFAASYAVSPPPTMLPGGRIAVPVTVRNTGSITWRPAAANPIRLAAHTADMAGNSVRWDGERTAFSADVAPGATVTTTVIVAAPRQPGSYRVRVDLVQEGVAWFSGQGVLTGDTFLTVIDDYRATLPGGPVAVSRALPQISVSLTNSSSAVWTPDGDAPVSLSSHWLDAAGAVLVWDGPRARLPKVVGPGETLTLSLPLGVVPPGAAFLTIDPVAEGLRWFGVGIARPVTLAP